MTQTETILVLKTIREKLKEVEYGTKAHIYLVNKAWEVTERQVYIEDIRNAKYTDEEFIDEYIRRLS